MTRTVDCIKLKKSLPGLAAAPFPGPMGQKIFDQVSQEAWQGWVKHQTMLVNENRLNLADAKARQYLRTQLENYFFGSGADAIAGYVPQK